MQKLINSFLYDVLKENTTPPTDVWADIFGASAEDDLKNIRQAKAAEAAEILGTIEPKRISSGTPEEVAIDQAQAVSGTHGIQARGINIDPKVLASLMVKPEFKHILARIQDENRHNGLNLSLIHI